MKMTLAKRQARLWLDREQTFVERKQRGDNKQETG